MLTSSPSDGVEAVVAARIRARRVAAGLTQKELADKLGISEHKLLNFETCRARLHLADVLQIAGILGVSVAVLLEDFAVLPPLDWYFAARNPALAGRAPDSVEQRIAATLWLERHFAQLYRLNYPLLYFMEALRRPVQFKAAWQLPVEDDPQRLLYVAEAAQGLVGYFFANEMQPGSDLGQADTPWPADIRDWRTEDELERYLQAAGYCVQLYPERLHIEGYCRLAHEGEQAMPREAADWPKPRAAGGLGRSEGPILPRAAQPAPRIRGRREPTRVRHIKRTPRGVRQTTEER